MPLSEVNLKEFLADVFVETGTYLADGILRALAAGFKRVHSIELPDARELSRAQRRIAGKRGAQIHLGSSPEVLPRLLKGVAGTVTFWLDAHPGGHLTLHEGAAGRNYAPVLEELDAIEASEIKNMRILIDDLRMFSAEDVKELETRLKDMGASKIYRRNGVVPDDILVGEIYR